jgi:hypothetical protein
MTNEEAYELFVKYNTEDSIQTTMRMIHTVGVDGTLKQLEHVFKEMERKDMPEDYREWLTQSLTYLANKISNPLN